MSETPVLNPVRIFFTATASIALFACMNLFVKLASDTQSIAQIMFFRSAFAMVPILFLMLRVQDAKVFKTTRPMGHALRGIVGMGGMVCSFLSFSLLPMAQATAINFASPLILTALSVPLLKEKVGIHRWSAVVIGLIAVLIMLQPTGHTNWMGNGVALAGAFFSAFAMINVRRLGTTEHALTIVFYFTLTGTVAGFIGMLFMWTPIHTPTALLYLLLTGLLGGVAQVFLTYSYANAPAAYVSPFTYLAIVFSALFDIVIWHIYPQWPTLAGSGVIICCGIYVIFREMTKFGRPKIRTNLFGMTPVQPTDKDYSDPL